MLIAMTAGLAADDAVAGNAHEPRVPPTFPGGECFERLAAGDAALHVAVGIPREDTKVLPDEPDDSRRLQFFALCREPAPLAELPQWISSEDVEAAQAADPEFGEPETSAVLPSSSWADCIVPLTPGEGRMPITCEGVGDGFEIEADALPPGNWSIWGYTYEPSFNLWTQRVGVLRVDGDAEMPPALALTHPASAATLSTGRGMEVAGCVHGGEGTEVTLSWAAYGELAAFGEDAWEDFATITVPSGTEAFSVPFSPPARAQWQMVFMRATATDEVGTSVAYTRGDVIVEPGCDAPQGGLEQPDDLCGVAGDGVEPTDAGLPRPATTECVEPDDEAGTTGGPMGDESGDADADDAQGDDGDAGADADEGGGKGGCSVAATSHRVPSRERGGRAPTAIVVAGLGLLGWTRRRRARS